MVKTFSKIIFSLITIFSIIPTHGYASNNVWNELRKIEKTIENLGTSVYWANKHSFCKEGLLGAYIPTEDVIYICQANHQNDYLELLGTLKHEGWHAVQIKCNNGLALLTDGQMRAHLKKRDRKNLHLYHTKNKRAEAEARVVEQIPTTPWIKGVKEVCDL